MKAIVCGGGISGLAAAERLTAIGWEVVVVERTSGPRPQGYMIDFFGPGLQAVRNMGLEPRLEELGSRVLDFAYMDADGSPKAVVDYKRFSDGINGGLVSILRPDLESLLRESLGDAAEIRYGVTIEHVDNRPDRVLAVLSDGETVTADLLIGADGIHSQTRSQLFGPEQQFLRPLGMHTAAYYFEDADLAPRARNRFRLTDSLRRQVGVYGVRDDTIAVFAVHMTDEMELPGSPGEEIRRRYSDLGWIVPRVLERRPPDSQIYYDVVAQVEVPRWVENRTVLLGDAAYAVSLVAGQGASLGVAGAYVLARRLQDESDVDLALSHYERAWRPVVTERQRLGRKGLKWFLPTERWQLTVRQLVMKAMRLPALNRRLSSSLVGDLHVDVDSIAPRG